MFFLSVYKFCSDVPSFNLDVGNLYFLSLFSQSLRVWTVSSCPSKTTFPRIYFSAFFSGSWLGPGGINMRFGRQKEAAPSSQADGHCSAPACCCFSVGSPDGWGQQTSLRVLQILLDLPLQFLQILVQVHQRVGHLRH